ncbi:MAG: hypothetical protein EA376_00480 [Phycisphaeraceae bacterium]|nr:MAG: hypothetical protein EA376_00480 [Phycisphaeraceae bacterium]
MGDRLWAGLAGEETDGRQAELLPVRGGDEDGAAGAAHVFIPRGFAVAIVALAQQIGDARHIAGGGPELPGCGAADDGVGAQPPPGREPLDGLVGAAGPEWVLLVADEPRAHGVLAGLSGKRLKQPPARLAAVPARLRVAAVRTQGLPLLRRDAV